MQLISSRVTPWLRLLPLAIWPLDAGLVLLLAGAGILPLPHRIALPGEAMLRVVWFLLGLPLIVLPFIAWWSWGLKRVATDGAVLLVDDGFKRDAIALNYIGSVTEPRGTLLRVVTFSVDRDTPWGLQIRFLAPLRGDVPPAEEHPTATTLREVTRRARG